MLSTNYRKRLSRICSAIERRETVELQEMVWAQKLAKVNTSAAQMLKKARLTAQDPDMKPGGMSEFLRDLGIGNDGADIITGDSSTDDIIDFFKTDRPEDWRQRD